MREICSIKTVAWKGGRKKKTDKAFRRLKRHKGVAIEAKMTCEKLMRKDVGMTGNVVVYILETSLSPLRDDHCQTTQSKFRPTKVYIPALRFNVASVP